MKIFVYSIDFLNDFKMKFIKVKKLWIASFILLIAIACSKVPLTGRRQLSLIPESEMISLSLTQYGQFLKENKVSTDQTKTAMVRRVGERIAKAVESYMAQAGLSDNLKGYQWEFNLIENKEVNAWCMPGGKVVVYTGLLPVAQNDEGLATVLGHEIAHAVARHGSERMSQQLIAQLGSTTLSAALADKPQATQQIANAAFGIGSQVGVLLPFSRKQESEADHLGLIFMAMAGYNPQTAVAFWQRMSQIGGSSSTPEFLSTHPVNSTRIRDIQKELPEAMKYYRGSK
jgi:predicted Zn-dependent protease